MRASDDQTDPPVVTDVASSQVDTGRARKSVCHTLQGAGHMARAAARRTNAGEGGIDELRAAVALATEVRNAIDSMCRHLLSAEECSNAEIAEVLGISRQAVAQRYPGASARPVGGQRAGLR